MTDGQRKRNKISHTRMRIKERYGLNVSGSLIRSLCDHRGQVLAYLMGGGAVHKFDIDGLDVLIIFNGEQPVTAITQDMLQTSWF